MSDHFTIRNDIYSDKTGSYGSQESNYGCNSINNESIKGKKVIGKSQGNFTKVDECTRVYFHEISV